ncbi:MULTISPECIES: hypothetical protein [unclassified Rathayibacter]|uniref:hypothetical protein n=1 Tax=unclassified Rathayibacter TaxID=2609250 RepID=UPI0010D67794|nr:MULTISPECIES: hypothetical protein [unclassified Rathayibacter]MCJ1688225.1 hypothetical protein [Rathayibacter sp. VKM Ac-2927]TCL82007.1 hypothetical protein EDF49_10614 [Rathayibacter sp. PhB192]TCM27223.1 hypothetical protein EDF43_10614 [Rathayibacter sp. PhB179]
MTPPTAFVLAALWAALAAWGAAIGSTPFLIGGLVMAVAFAALGVVLRRRARR